MNATAIKEAVVHIERQLSTDADRHLFRVLMSIQNPLPSPHPNACSANDAPVKSDALVSMESKVEQLLERRKRVAHLYTVELLDSVAIARLVGVNKTTVLDDLRAMNVERRSRTDLMLLRHSKARDAGVKVFVPKPHVVNVSIEPDTTNDDAIAKSYVDDKESMRTIADRYNVSEYAVRCALGRKSIAIRDYSERAKLSSHKQKPILGDPTKIPPQEQPVAPVHQQSDRRTTDELVRNMIDGGSLPKQTTTATSASSVGKTLSIERPIIDHINHEPILVDPPLPDDVIKHGLPHSAACVFSVISDFFITGTTNSAMRMMADKNKITFGEVDAICRTFGPQIQRIRNAPNQKDREAYYGRLYQQLVRVKGGY